MTEAAQAVADEAPTPTPITLRAPLTSGSPPASSAYTPPSTKWLEGTWHVTHSTLPMWKKARNVAITYKPLPSSAPDGPVHLDDLVTYQGLTSDKLKTVSGVDKPDGQGAWNWRGNGWLMIASSHWQALGHGGDEGGEQWVVTYFAKTLFTPAGLDIYSRQQQGLTEKTLAEIREALKKVDAEDVKALESKMFGVAKD